MYLLITELSLAESGDHKTRVLSATYDGNQLEKENPIRKVTDGVHEGIESDSFLRLETSGEEESRKEPEARDREEIPSLSEQVTDNSFKNLVNFLVVVFFLVGCIIIFWPLENVSIMNKSSTIVYCKLVYTNI